MQTKYTVANRIGTLELMHINYVLRHSLLMKHVFTNRTYQHKNSEKKHVIKNMNLCSKDRIWKSIKREARLEEDIDTARGKGILL